MGKERFLEALKRHMAGINPDIQARTLAYYEQRFIDGLAAGRSEDEIATDLDDPKKIAMTLRASSHRAAFAQNKTPVNAVRMLFSMIGLLIFNTFMVVPAIVYASMLAAMYVCALAFYLSGVVITASGLSGVHDIVIDGPLHHSARGDDGTRTKISIGKDGIHISPEKVGDDPVEASRAAIEASREALERSREEMQRSKEEGKQALREALKIAAEASRQAARDIREGIEDGIEEGMDEAGESTPNRSERVLRRAEAMADHGISFSSDLDGTSRTTTTVVGLGLVVGGILLFLLCLVVSKYTLIGLRRYIDMNIALLMGR